LGLGVKSLMSLIREALVSVFSEVGKGTEYLLKHFFAVFGKNDLFSCNLLKPGKNLAFN